MDIPIKFKFFDKLKLYQDYLKEDSMLEKTKNPYWLCEKAILFWGYSGGHQHLGTPLVVGTFTEIKMAGTISKTAENIGGGNYEAIEWVKSQITNCEAVIQVLDNLVTLELATRLSNLSDEIKIKLNLKGFLLGELLFEAYEKPGFWLKNYRMYKLALFVFYTTFIVLFLTIFLVFLEQLFRVIKPEYFIAINTYIGGLFGQSWWTVITTSFLVYVTLRQVWKKL